MSSQPETDEQPWEMLNELAEAGEAESLEKFLDTLPPGEQAHSLSRLSEDQQCQVFETLRPDDAADLLSRLPDAQAVGLIQHLPPETAARIVEEMPSDEQADLIGGLEEEQAEAILDRMDPLEAAAARSLVRYEDDTAGGLMITEFLQFSETATAGQVIDDLAAGAETYRDFDVQYAYICDRLGRLTGVLRLRDLLLAGRSRPVREIMIHEPLSVPHDTSLDDLVELLDQHHFLGVPVTDHSGRFLGVVRRTAVDEAWGARHEADYMKSQGIPSGEELRSMPLAVRARGRLAWLSVNIVLNIGAASVIANFQDTLSSVLALTVFLPMISDMSGCSGNQAVAVSMRELSLGLVVPSETMRVWLKEVSLGLINGSVLGTLVGVGGWLWQDNFYLGLVVGAALAMNTIVAVSLGGIVPLLLRRFGFDPAVASGPLLTTVTDMCGFSLVFGLATLFLAQLTGS
ncbi:magnesium transporter [Candidatus Laterigemmans baculatus]|uniref:magnesium transporter n=1 Tax=Candidatus Laterigemmans baculatus TaxID=2770505 RepID=UPI001F311B83|nr:magnesium transporter [Candidatus Laterigemmans baculatus]